MKAAEEGRLEEEESWELGIGYCTLQVLVGVGVDPPELL